MIIMFPNRKTYSIQAMVLHENNICCRCGDEIDEFEPDANKEAVCDWCQHMMIEAADIRQRAQKNHLKSTLEKKPQLLQ